MKFKTDGNACAPVVGAVIVCAGKGERTGLPYNKVLHQLGQKTVLETTLDVFSDIREIAHITVVTSELDRERIEEIASNYPDTSVTIGGDTRAQSVYNGLKAYPCDIAIIHDGARPFVTKEIIIRSIESAIEYGSGIAAVRSVDTVKRVGADGKVQSLPRAELYNMQTPQTFRYAEIAGAYARGADECTDDAEVYAAAGYTPHLIEGDYDNIKITVASDLYRALPRSCRVGAGFDVHRLVPNRPLILGGVKIEYMRGLDGHSDADVLTHAIMDALLSAAGLPDIGVLFPDTDDKYLGASSIALLKDVIARIRDVGLTVGNISATVAAQRPKLAPVIPEIRKSLANTMDIDITQINVSATTTEELGIIGSGDAMSANAACILTESRSDERR